MKKRRIFSILFALVLVLSFSLATAVPAAADYAAFDNADYYYAVVKDAPEGTKYRSVGLNPDGTKLIAQKSWNDGVARTEIVLMDADGTNETIISPGDSGEGLIIEDYGVPFWSDDGTAIGFREGHFDDAGPDRVMRYDMLSGITTCIYEPDALLNGHNADFLGSSKTSIVFWDWIEADGAADLFIWNGTTRTNITNSPDYSEYEPVSNADGTVIVYWSGEKPAEPINTTHTLTESGGTWTKDVNFTPIPGTFWAFWSGRADNYIGLTTWPTKDVAVYDSTGAFVMDLTGPGYSSDVGQWNYFGFAGEGPNGEFVMTSTAGTDPAVSRDIIFAVPRTALFVDDDGLDSNPGTEAAPFATVQKAIDEAAPDGTVNVAAGTYDETVAIGTGLDNLTLQGTGPANTVISNGLKFDTSAGDLTGLSVSSLALKGNAGTYGEGVTVGHIGNGYVYDLSFDNVLFDGEEVVGMAAYINPLAGTFRLTNSEVTGYTDWGTLYLGEATLDAGPTGPSLSTVTFQGDNIHDNKGSSVVYGNKDNFTDLFVIQDNEFRNNGGHQWFWASIEVRNADNVLAENNDFEGAPVGMEDIHGAALYFTNDNNGLFNGDVTRNNFLNNYQAIYFYSGNVSGLRVNFNNFSGNDIAIDARGEDNPTGILDATNNWWDDASGPIPPGTYESYGDKVSDNVDYEPWLLKEVTPGVEPTTYDKTLALKDGWTLVSTDKALSADRVWVGVTMAYKYAPTIHFEQVDDLAGLEPLTAMYVKTDGGGGVGFDYAEAGPGVIYSKELEAGWNLISIPSISGNATTGAILSPLRYVTLGTQQGVGLATLVSQGDYNQFSGSFYLATLTDANWDSLVPLDPFDGYWAYMNAAKTFEVIPD